MVVPVDELGRVSGPGGLRTPSSESRKPKIISELRKREPPTGSPQPPDCPSPAAASEERPRMSGLLQCARSEWSPRWERRFVRVCHGSLEVYLAEEEGARGVPGTRPRRRLPLRNLSLRRVPRRQHAFAIYPRGVNAPPLILCQADDAESFSRWTRTLAVELMKQTPLGEVRFHDILRITEPTADDEVSVGGVGERCKPATCFTDEVERLKELCQRGEASVHERRLLFEALGGVAGGGGPRKQLSSSRPCASSEDLGQPPACWKPGQVARAKRAKSLHDLPSDFPCALVGGAPVSVVSQLRLFFERMGRPEDGPAEDPECRAGRSTWGPGSRGQPKKTVRSQSYTCESARDLARSCNAICELDSVFLKTNQKLGLGKDVTRGGKGTKDLPTVDNTPCPETFNNMASKDRVKKDVNVSSYSKQNSLIGTHDVVKIDLMLQTENIPLAANLLVSSNSQPSSLSNSLSSESLSSSLIHSVPSPSSSCSSLSLNLSTPSSSPNSQLHQHHYILSMIKKQAAEEEEIIWNLQEEMAKLDRERIAAHSNEKKITRKPRTPKRTYGELEAQLHEEESKLDKLYKEAERVLKIIERSVKQDAVLASMNQCQVDKKWCELNNGQKFNLRGLTS